MSGNIVLDVSCPEGEETKPVVFPVNLYAAQNPNTSTISHTTTNTSSGLHRTGLHMVGKVNDSRLLNVIHLMNNQGKRKRGPREKDTFQRFMYCLADKYDKLPKFTSFEQNEKAMVKAHQQLGYGYPAQDFKDGGAQKTHINLSYNADQFKEFIRVLFPNLQNRKWDIYRIDKQRRLLRVDQDTPRGIKDLKYQGYLIIIPYNDDSDRPQSVIYRTGEEYFIQMTTDQPDHVILDDTDSDGASPSDTFDVEQQESFSQDSRPTPIASPTQLTSQMTSAMTQHIPSSTTQHPGSSHSPIKKDEMVDQCEPFPVSLRSSQPQPERIGPRFTIENNTDMLSTAKCKLARIAEAYRGCLHSPLSVTIRKEHLVDDVLRLYRGNENFTRHHIRVLMTQSRYQTDQMVIPTASLLVMFWREIFDKHFKGDREYVPVVDLDKDECFFVTLGKILYHGLILFNYWPVNLAQACTAVILTEKCSDSQLTTSFYNVMSESEKTVVSEAKKEVRSNMTDFSLPVLRNLCKVLRPYGNKVKPQPRTFESLILRLSRFYLVRNPYWALTGVGEGFFSGFSGNLPVITEQDVFELYARLSPNALALFEKVEFIYSPPNRNSSIEMEEKRTKMYLEVAVMRMTSRQIATILTKWCYFDCLCVDQLYMRFHSQSVSEPPVFAPDTRTLNISSVYSSQEEFNALLTSQLEESSDITSDVITI